MLKNKNRQVIDDKAMIYEMRQTGLSMREIGETIGITRERVRQILQRYYGTTCHQFISTAQLSVSTGLPVNRIMRLSKKGIITPVLCYTINTQRRLIWSRVTIQILKDYYSSNRICQVCKKLLPPNRRCYCSEHCHQEKYRYKNMSQEEKKGVLARICRYRKKKQLTT